MDFLVITSTVNVGQQDIGMELLISDQMNLLFLSS